jgi:hypothetical protein
MFPRKKEFVVDVNNTSNNYNNVRSTRKAIGHQEEIERRRQQQELQPEVPE